VLPRLLTILPVLVLCAAAETPVATVSSPEPFVLDGVQIPVAGVPSWPLVGGDEVSTTNAPAVISFQDTSQVTLDKNSRAKLKRNGAEIILFLVQGTFLLRSVAGSKVRVSTPDRAVTPPAGSEVQVSVAAGSNTSQVSSTSQITTASQHPASKPKPPPPPPPPSPHQ
jgi:hypothetical protein